MRYYFHADTEKYASRRSSLTIIVIMPLITACVFCMVNVILNIGDPEKRELIVLMAAIIAGCVLCGMIFCFAVAYFTEMRIRRHSRYTFFDILPKGMVFSLYAGEYVMYGEKTVCRRLCYIPFAGLESVSRDPKEDPFRIRFTGEIHEYLLPSDGLGYHIDENDELVFDKWELNFRCFERKKSLEIKDRFGSTKSLEKSVLYYWEQFKSIPEKKPFNLSEHLISRPKRHTGTSNPALDAPSFDRKW